LNAAQVFAYMYNWRLFTGPWNVGQSDLIEAACCQTPKDALKK
jgi:hypothetical protein